MCGEIELADILGQEHEQMPEWLAAGPPFTFNRDLFFGSRTLFYPGSGLDGQPVSLIARSHAAHAFIYVDYGVGMEEIREQVHGPDPCRFRGYTVEHEENPGQGILRPGGWTQHEGSQGFRKFVNDTFYPFALFVVLKRDEGHDDGHGPERLAGLFVGGDGFATYDALYCQGDGTPAPYLAALQDHGFGGNHGKFGRDGLLEQIAKKCSVWPEWLLVADNTQAWAGYERIPSCPEQGGMHGHERHLYRLSDK